MNIKLDNINKYLGAEFCENYIINYLNSDFDSEKMGIETYLTNNKLGIEYIVNENKELTTIFFFNNQTSGNFYNGSLPFDLSFDMNKEEVRKLFGEPFKSNDGIPALDVFPSDVYLRKDFRFSVSYSKNDDTIIQFQITIENFD